MMGSDFEEMLETTDCFLEHNTLAIRECIVIDDVELLCPCRQLAISMQVLQSVTQNLRYAVVGAMFVFSYVM